MHKGFIKTAAALGALSVILGAFGAHALRQLLNDNGINIFETGVRYQFYHVFALFVTGILYKDFNKRLIKWAGLFFIAGIILFSGSLYLLTCIKGFDIAGYLWIGAITPFGGLFFITGWVCLVAGV